MVCEETRETMVSQDNLDCQAALDVQVLQVWKVIQVSLESQVLMEILVLLDCLDLVEVALDITSQDIARILMFQLVLLAQLKCGMDTLYSL